MQSTQSIIDNRVKQSFNKSIIDNRVRTLYPTLCSILGDNNYSKGHLYKIAKKLSDHEIMQVADYCSRKANTPGRAFVSITERKIA